jgi:alpha-ketoglutarate-dependent taurine dioxygenase
MSPIDPRSRRLAHAISASNPDYSHSWREPGEIIIIDNHHILHSRDDAGDAPDREIYRLLLSDVKILWRPGLLITMRSG